jgi:hypothetical protein
MPVVFEYYPTRIPHLKMKPPQMHSDRESTRNKRFDMQCRMIMCIVAIFFVGCSSLTASLPKKTPESEDYAARTEARTLLAALSNQNNSLKNFKGIGKIKIWHNGKLRINEQAAWAGSETVKLSIVILISGHPAVRMTSDGKWFYYYEAREGRPLYKKIPATDANLKRLISIPIKAEDIVSLLAGRVPLREHHSTLLEKQDSGNGYVLVLKRRWWGVIEKIFLDQAKSRVHQVEFYNRSGKLIYLARFDEMQTINGYRVPSRLRLSNEAGAELQLDVDRYWPDVEVSSSTFILKPPD